MISSEFGIVVVVLFNNPQTKLYQFRENNVPLKQNCRSTVVIPGTVEGGITVTYGAERERGEGGEGETTCVKGSFVS